MGGDEVGWRQIKTRTEGKKRWNKRRKL